MRRRLTGLLIVAVFAASACGQSSGSPSASAFVPVAFASKAPASAIAQTNGLTDSTYKAVTATNTTGKVVLGESQFPDTVNPYYALNPTDMEVSDSMFDGLLTVTPDLKYVPDLALNVPTLDNGEVVLNGEGMDVNWKLRPGMQWSDGQPITCDDIATTWRWILDKDNHGLAEGTIGWQDVSGVDGGAGIDCVMHFSKIYEGYLSLVSPLLPAHYITTVPVKDAQSKLFPMSNLGSGVYSGPYIPVSVEANAKINLKPNPKWESIGGHAPWLTSVTWRYYGDVGTMINGFAGGDYDVGNGLTNLNESALAGTDSSKIVAQDSMTYELLAFNNASFATKYPDDASYIIQAIKLATDRQAIAKGPLGGFVDVTNNYVSPQSWYYKDIGGSNKADAATAYTILANAGWVKGADGYLVKAGKPLTVNLCTTTRQFRLDSLNLISQQLGAIGIKATVVTRPDSDVFGLWDQTKANTQCNLRRGNFDVAEFTYRVSFDPLSGYRIYHSSQIPGTTPLHDGENISRVSLPALDAAYETIASTVNLSKVRDAMFAVQDLYGSDRNTYELPLYFRKDVWLVNPKLHNFVGNPTFSAGEWNMGDWWVG
ncbi:MAG TPA: ABC transporter substrate-binding protein [Candidatus Limnocylindrales bacterium]